MARQTLDPQAPRIALVIEGSRSHADHRTLSLLADALSDAGVTVQRLHHGLGRLARFRLRQQLRRFAADLVVASGAASIEEVLAVAQPAGKPVVGCYWPLGVVHNLHAREDRSGSRPSLGRPAHAIIGTAAQRAALETWSVGPRPWPRERIHQVALPDGEGPPTASLQAIVQLLLELLSEQGQRSLSHGLLRASAARVLPLVKKPRGLSLAYHQVLRELRGPDLQLVVGATTFEQQIRALLQRGYRPLSQAAQARELLSGAAEQAPSFSVSFDDGYVDTLEVAAPVLRALGVPFTVFVVTDVMLGTLRLPWYELVQQSLAQAGLSEPALAVLAEHAAVRDSLALRNRLPPQLLLPQVMRAMKQLSADDRRDLCDKLWAKVGAELIQRPGVPRYLDQAGVRKLQELGAEVSSHTCRHDLLPSLRDEDLAQELSESRRVLIELCGSCGGLAYPNGDSDARVEAAAAKAGYEYAVGVTPVSGPPSRFRLGRQMISELFALGTGGRMNEPLFVAKLLRGK
ncbi:MAG TPA: polysaccharide deacetylase family protein [Pseudomonadota bacterium]|nr:polysaccharide deacetylase family protein [Pseudomonadota bacterium]